MFSVLTALSLLALAALPALMVIRNLPQFERAPTTLVDQLPPVSVLIPARDEERGIAAAVNSVLQNTAVPLEVIVLDDHSSDQTAAIVERISRQDPRVQLRSAPALPEGWNGKQHACWQLAQLAGHDLLLFMDADVRLEATALQRLLAHLQAVDVPLLSGFPRQRMLTIPEKMLVPMMYFVLLGYLPLERMRASSQPEFGAGCGQLFLARKASYFAAGGHAAIRNSRHDGLKLPRSFRAAGLRTDLFDASDIAHVRMYCGWKETWNGLLKNATEGIANWKLIGIFSVLLLGAAVLPILVLAHAIYWRWTLASIVILGLATLISFLPRAMIAARLSHSWIGVLLHPIAVAIFVAAQWTAFLREQLGFQAVSWRGRH